MKIITGDDCGIIKEIIPGISQPNGNAKETKNEGKINRLGTNADSSMVSAGSGLDMKRCRGVIDLAFCPTPTINLQNNSAFCALRMDGSVERWEKLTNSKSKDDKLEESKYVISSTWKDLFGKSKLERPIAMRSIQRHEISTNSSGIVACCSNIGSLTLIDVNNAEKNIVAQYSAFGKNGKDVTISETSGKAAGGEDLATGFDMDYDGKRIAVGGKDRSAVILDVETGEVIWKAKNIPPNSQTLLQQPIWSTAFKFLDPSSTTPIAESSDILAIGTAYKQLQIYDVRASSQQRRPTLYTPEFDSNKKNLFDHRLTCLTQVDSNRIVVGDAAGNIHSVDLRKLNRDKATRCMGAIEGRFYGPAGSVKQIVKHETLPIIACVGLDRMMRTFNLNTRKQLGCFYLKQRLNSLLICDDNKPIVNEEEENNDTEIFTNDNAPSSNYDVDEEDDIQLYVDSSDDEGGEYRDGKNIDVEDHMEYSNDEASSNSDSSEDSNIDTDPLVANKKNGLSKNLPASKRQKK